MATRLQLLERVHEDVVACERCERLRTYCLEVAREKRRAFAEWVYWGRPVPGFGDERAGIWIIGLAPAAHGANRTGRIFTGDRSGDFLFAALHRAGLANQAASVRVGDGLELRGVYISASARCAPPGNRPLPGELANCSEYLDREWKILKDVKVLLALGAIGWEACLGAAGRRGMGLARREKFGHGREVRLSETLTLVGSYHVSQQNTFTGKLTEGMFDRVVGRCKELAGIW